MRTHLTLPLSNLSRGHFVGLLAVLAVLLSLPATLFAAEPVLKDNAREYLALRKSLGAVTLTTDQLDGGRGPWRGKSVELFGRILGRTNAQAAGAAVPLTFTLSIPGVKDWVMVDAHEEHPLLVVENVVHVLADLAPDARPSDHFLMRAVILESDLPAEEQRYAAAEAAAAKAAGPPLNKIDVKIPQADDDAKRTPVIPDEKPAPPVDKPVVRPGTEMPQLNASAAKGVSAWKQWVAKQNGRLTDGQLELIVRSVIYYSALYGVDHRLMFAVIRCESSFNPSCVSHAGAIGMCQLMPGTARALGVDPWDIERNIAGGVKYISDQLRAFAGRSNWEQCALALAAYNAGPGAVKRAGGIPNIPETVRYVEKVTKLFYELYKAGLP
ncbi:MAG: lytic transglycosylase domain-containing protein [Armatimonadia bacterium]